MNSLIKFAFNSCSLLALLSLGSDLVAEKSDTEPHFSSKLQPAFEPLEVEASMGWDTHYYSEGRDALDGDSITTSSIDLAWKQLIGGICYGDSPDQPYEELQLSAGATYSIGDFDLEAAYTHLRFPKEQTHDDEVGISIVWTGLPKEIELRLDADYSFDAEGYFSELSASRAFELTEDAALSLTGILGMNQDYVSEGHDGLNHFALVLGFDYALTESLSIGAHTTYSWAIDQKDAAPDDELLVDFLHGGVSVSYAF